MAGVWPISGKSSSASTRPAKRAVFQHEAALFQRAAGAFNHAFGGEWFRDEIIGAVVKGIDRHRHITVAGYEDNRQIGINPADMVEELKPGHAGHAHR